MSIAQHVRQKFEQVPEGGVIASRELHTLSTQSQQVDKAASRLYKAQGLKKLRNGLYYKPYNSRYFGKLPPKDSAVIRSIKRQYSAKVSLSGPLAAYDLGLTHTLPDVISYETDKRISPIRLDDHTLHFRKVDGKKLSSVESSLLLILKALEYLHNEAVALTPLQQKRISRLLNRYPNEKIHKAVALWPSWFQEKFKSQFQVSAKPYITGLSALNIPYHGKQADWHQMGMLYSNKFQIAGGNYESAPGLSDQELFDCELFLNKFNIDVGTTLCAIPARAIKDILYTSIFKRSRYPGFFMLDQFMLDIPKKAIREILEYLEQMANDEQKQLLRQWARENELI